jgi:hypothetical protein
MPSRFDQRLTDFDRLREYVADRDPGSARLDASTGEARHIQMVIDQAGP